MFLKCALLILLCDVIAGDMGYYQTLTCRLPRIEHGRVRTRQRSKLVKFMCSNRYELVGNRYATCRNGNWDVPTPVCVRPGCPYLPLITNGVQIKAHHDAWVVNFCLPGYKLQGSHSMFCDGIRWNATVPKCVEDTELDKASLSCDFEDENICGWTQDELHDFDWKRLNRKTPSSFLFTGPSYDHTYGKGHSGYYMYIESTSRLENDTARLLSPIYDASLANDSCFSFYYHMFGKEIGGLRVYQKPDRLRLHEMLNTSAAQYLLFEQWGNLGDTWFQAVPALKDFSDGFQIVIEGIRGSSFTSDIAIDDVSILQGENCTAARNNAIVPNLPNGTVSESCVGRCWLGAGAAHAEATATATATATAAVAAASCDCTPMCLPNNNCCPDFLEVCVFEEGATTDDDTYSPSAELPQTQKLVGETTTTTTSTTTTQKPTTKSTTLPSTTPKVSPTTKLVTSTTTTASPTTIKTTTTKKPTTPRPVPKTIKTTKKAETTTKKPITTTKRVVSTTRKVETTTRKVTTTTNPRLVTKSVIDEGKMKKKIENETMTIKKLVPDKAEKVHSSTWKIAVITVVVLALCASLLYLGVAYRGTRGLVALQTLWGRTRNDPEVRYLNSNDDDEL